MHPYMHDILAQAWCLSFSCFSKPTHPDPWLPQLSRGHGNMNYHGTRACEQWEGVFTPCLSGDCQGKESTLLYAWNAWRGTAVFSGGRAAAACSWTGGYRNSCRVEPLQIARHQCGINQLGLPGGKGSSVQR